MIIMLCLFNMFLIDQPDIIVPDHGIYGIQLRFGPTGDVITYGTLGLFNRLSLGISYGASNLIGAGNPEFYHQPGVQIRVKAIEEAYLIPTVILGLDNQGYGSYDEDGERYQIMSKGIYLQVGRQFEYPDFAIAPNLGLNYCFESDGRLDMFVGIKFSIKSSVQILFDYSPNISDELDQNKGYFNTALNLILHEDVFCQFALRDLLDNGHDQQMNRMVKFGFFQSF